MTQPETTIKKLVYKSGMVYDLALKKHCPSIKYSDSTLPSEITALIEEKNILDLEGSYGDKEGYSPIQYNKLTLKATNGKETVIEFYNRAMSLIKTDDETLKSIHRVFCEIEKHMPSAYNKVT